MDYKSSIPYYRTSTPTETYYKEEPVMRGIRHLKGGGSRLQYIVIAVLLIGMLLIVINVYELRRMQDTHFSVHHGAAIVEAQADKTTDKVAAPTTGHRKEVWFEAKRMHTGYLKHVTNVFDRLDYARGGKNSDWDVLWAHDYPFGTLKATLQNLKPHQRVNKFPGSGYITNKVSLATSKIDYIPPAFKMPTQKQALFQYAKKYPDKMFVQKSNNHRGIKIHKINELDLSSDNTFVQEYVDRPFLIDGHKFDIGIYATLTSINPLRAYILEDELLLRFCPIEYYPFDPYVVDKYVVGDDYLPTWKVPSLKKIYTDQSNNFKQTLIAYLRQKGHDYEKLFNDIRESVRQVYLNKESALIQAAGNYKTTRNFFEMVRFDYVFDEDLNIYLMEVNMSPNLSSGHFTQNRQLYEHVVFDMLNLVGVARSTTDLQRSSPDGADMLVSDRMTQVFPDVCSKECEDNCRDQRCKLCHQCMTINDKQLLKTAYLEHMNKRNFGRIFPPSFDSSDYDVLETEQFKSLNEKNQWMYMWFLGKCRLDPAWCQ